MRVHWIQHVHFEHLGHLEPALRARGARFTRTRALTGDPYPDPDSFDWLVVMGGPMSVNDTGSLAWMRTEIDAVRAAIEAGRTVLGVCLGAQVVARALGAQVRPNERREIGWFPVEPVPQAVGDPLTRAMCGPQAVFHWHTEVCELPDGATALARSEACPLQAFRWGERVLALQFHLEMTVEGARQLVEGCRQELDPPDASVHTEEQILGDEGRFFRAHDALEQVLEHFSPHRGAAGS